MSKLKPCLVLHSNDGTIRERCAKCPNRKPVSLEELVKRVREHYLDTMLADMSGTEDSAFNSGIATAVEVILAYQKELNNG